jgi:RIO-like serine/threonine protein kinase
MFETLTLADIPKKQCGILRKQSNTRPAVWRIEERGTTAIIKDFHCNGFFYRNIVGRFLVWREAKAYRRLNGLEGVPAFFRTIKGLALVVEEIQGADIETLNCFGSLDEGFYNNLKVLINNIHKRGLVHCDLKRAPNIMKGDDGKPYIVDWAAAISMSEFRLFPLRLIYRRFLHDDLNAVTKLKLKYRPDSVSQEEKDMYMTRSRLETAIREIRNFFRVCLKKIT